MTTSHIFSAAAKPRWPVRSALLSLLTAIFMVTYAVASPTPAGTLIVNQARAVIDGEQVVPSNRVQTVVQEVCVPRLSPDGRPDAPGQRLGLVAPASAYVPYRLANHGNVEAAFTLSWRLADGAAWAPRRVEHYLDANGNGLVDPGEEPVDAVVLEAAEWRALVLAIAPPASALGDLTITPVADCGDVPANDASALVQARAAIAPALRLQQRVEPVADVPGDSGARYRATITLANYGGGDAVQPTLTVDLEPLLDHGVVLDVATLRAAKGVTEVETSSGWRAPVGVSDGSDVRRLRLLSTTLAPDEDATLTFDLVAPTLATPSQIPLVSVAESEGDDGVARAVSYLDIAAVNRHALEFVDPNLVLVENQSRCFPARLANLGTQADRYSLNAAAQLADASDVTVALETTSRLPLAPTLALDVGATLDFLVCVRSDVARDDPFDVLVRATSAADGDERIARGTVRAVQPADALTLVQSADPMGTVTAGTELSYTLTVRNGYTFPLTNLRARVDLVDELEFAAAGMDGTHTDADHVVRWTLPRLEPGGEIRLPLTVRVAADVADDTTLRNRFALRAVELANPLVSNTIVHTTWSSDLLLRATVSPERGVTYGDLLTYTLEVTNPATAPLVITLTERMPDGVDYLSSERVANDGGGPEPLEPSREGQTLVWNDLPLDANATLIVRYRARVLPSAPLLLESRTTARGLGASGASIAGAQGGTSLRVDAGVFERDRGVLLGQVFLDGNDDGRFDPDHDQPLSGVRLILANGTQTLTDTSGRYAFRGIDVGPASLLVDPASLGFVPRGVPGALDTHRFRVQVHGVTVHDVPVVAPSGTTGVARSTDLRLGPLHVRKELRARPEGTEVRLTLSTSEPLPELRLDDPLPNGGTKTYAFDLFEGSETLTYTVDRDAVLTDPQVRWRYP